MSRISSGQSWIDMVGVEDMHRCTDGLRALLEDTRKTY